jgi:hypothetical protein
VIPDVDKNWEPLPLNHPIYTADAYYPGIESIQGDLHFGLQCIDSKKTFRNRSLNGVFHRFVYYGPDNASCRSSGRWTSSHSRFGHWRKAMILDLERVGICAVWGWYVISPHLQSTGF